MKHLVLMPLLFILVLSLPKEPVFANDAFPMLAGSWAIHNEEEKLVITFIDDKTLEYSHSSKHGDVEFTLRYEATAERKIRGKIPRVTGKITIYFDPAKNPKGEVGTWEIADDKPARVLYLKCGEWDLDLTK